jgi:hypothetical protein
VETDHEAVRLRFGAEGTRLTVTLFVLTLCARSTALNVTCEDRRVDRATRKNGP